MATLVLLSNRGKTILFPLSGNHLHIGRAASSDIVLDDMGVSRNHAAVMRDGDKFAIMDLSSQNGIAVNGVPVTHHVLKHGDVIKIGASSLRFLAVPTDE